MSKPNGAMRAFLYLCSGRIDPGMVHRNAKAMEVAFFARKGKEQSFVPVTEWYNESFAAAGTWESWVQATVVGTNPTTGGLRFIAYVFTETQIGKGNASIALLAKKRGRKLYYFDTESKEFHQVTGVIADDPHDFVGGWHVETAPLETV